MSEEKFTTIPWKPTRIEGYEAADFIIEEMMKKARENEPKRKVDKRSAAYRQAYFDGLLFAHCMMVMGAHPNSNVEPIRAALNRKAGA